MNEIIKRINNRVAVINLLIEQEKEDIDKVLDSKWYLRRMVEFKALLWSLEQITNKEYTYSFDGNLKLIVSLPEES